MFRNRNAGADGGAGASSAVRALEDATMQIPRMPCVLLAAASFACSAPDRFALTGRPAEPTPSDIDAAAGVDENAVLAAIVQGAYATSPAFAQASTAYPSSAATGSTVVEWVSADALAAYQSIGTSGSDAGVPVGTIIVRVVEDSTGAATKLTLMTKGPAGYNPALGDWWFGVTDPMGVPAVSDAGVELGKLTGCYGCHLPRSADDFLFGVPADARAPHP
jgi:hypothetical protein